MFGNFSKLFVVVIFIFRAVSDNTACSLDQIVSQVTVPCFHHGSVLGIKLTGLVVPPDDAAVLCKGIIAVKAAYRAYFSKDPGGIYRSDPRNGFQDLIFCRVQTRNSCSDGFIKRLLLLFKGPYTVKGTGNGCSDRFIQSLIQPVRVTGSFLKQAGDLAGVREPAMAGSGDEVNQLF